MAEDFGLSFSPATTTDKTKAMADPNAPVQEAIRTLSLRIPKVTGGKGLAPAPLLNSMGSQGMGMPGGMGLEQLLAMLFGQRQPAQQGGPMSPGGAPLSPATSSFGAGQTSQPPTGGQAMPRPSQPLPNIRPGMEAGVESQALPGPTRSAADYFSDKMDTPRMSDGFNF
jgi:hypothetical protein